jgi:acyl dehydratase
MSEVVELAAAPNAGRAYRRAALGLLTRRSGTELPQTTLVLRDVALDRGRLAGYDRVCGYRLTDTLPATYPHVLAFPLAMSLMSGGDFPLPVVGLVHVANRVELLRPIGVDEHLELTVRAVDLREHERGRQFDIRATASVGDDVVWRGVSTYLRKEKPATSVRESEHRPPVATALWRVPADTGRRYAEVSGDHNPIHTSRLGARAFGFPRPIAHGMWTAARCLAALEGRIPDAYTLEVAFRRPVPLPATVAFAATARSGGWALALHDPKSGAPHLTARLSSPGH